MITDSELAARLLPYLLRNMNASAASNTTITGGAGVDAAAAGAGLTFSSGTLNVGAGLGITVNADDVALTTPGTLTVSTSNTATGSHTHAVTSSSSPGAAASILATDASGYLSLVRLTASDRVVSPLITSASGNITITPASTSVILSDSRAIATTTFASGFAGSGFRIDQGISYASQTTAEFDNLIVRGLMRVYELVINKIRVSRGSLIVSPGGGKVASVTGSGPYTINFEDDHGLAAGDLLRAQKFTGSGTYQSLMTVSSVTDSDTVVATLDSGSAPAAGYEYAVTGNTSNAARQGVLYLTADDSGSPFMDIVAGLSAHSGGTGWGSASLFRTRVGRLDGIFSTTNEYGLFAGNGTATSSQYVRVSNQGVQLNGVPLRMYSGANQTVNIDSAGTNVWVGASSSDRRLSWDGSSLRVIGSLVVGPGVGFSTPALFYGAYDATPGGIIPNTNGHRGQRPTTETNIEAVSVGIFGGALQVGEATTNVFSNSSFESGMTGWTVATGGGTGTGVQDTGRAVHGASSCRATQGSVALTVTQSITAITGAYSISAFVHANGGVVTSSLFRFVYNGAAVNPTTITHFGGGWYFCRYTSTLTAGSRTMGFQSYGTVWVDAIQLEQKSYSTVFTPSARSAAAVLRYNAINNINPARGSISAWVFVDDTNTVDGHGIVEAGSAWPYFGFWINSSGLQFLIGDGSGYQQITQACGYQAWRHVCATWDVSTGLMKVYVDGVSTASTTLTRTPAIGSNLYVGSLGVLSSYNFNGWIDDLAILDRALTDDEVSAIYQSEAPLNITRSNFELLLSDYNAGRVNANAGGIFGTDTNGKPTFTLLNSAATVNGESLGAGDTMLGDNTASAANFLFDQSGATLLMRSGTTTLATLDAASNALIFRDSGGTNRVSIGDDGVGIRADTAWSQASSINFLSGSSLPFSGTRIGEIWANTSGDMHIRSYTASNTNQNLYLSSVYNNTSAGAGAYVRVTASRYVSENSWGAPAAYLRLNSDYDDDEAWAQINADSADETALIYLEADDAVTRIDYQADNHYFTGTKSGFIIDHPLDPENKWLIHSPVESDRLRVVYDGEVTLDARGEAVVTMPEWFGPLTKNVRVMLSCVDSHMPVYVTDIRARRFTIAGGTSGRRVFWTLSAERADPWAEQRPLEIETNKPNDERGTLFAWREYGESRAKDWRKRVRDKRDAQEKAKRGTRD